ncbi:hypothetical protein N0V90_009027 [Kalmusia sp. IMI 367209]|nr:hypothetical protein N0V90_009027 [Kalmusia sp. IMI 367209]
MGLPVWRAPSPEAQNALKTDRTGPARSPIRRRRLTRSPRSPRLRDRNAHASLSSSRPRPSAYPPAPNVPARNHLRRGDHTPGPAADDDSSSARSYFRLTTDAPRGLSMPLEERTLPLPFTPNFAPATASRRAGGTARPRSTAPSIHIRSPLSVTEGRNSSMDNDEDSGDNVVGFPPLRRMGRRTIADGPLPASSLRESWSPATTLDGLGDRERSLSPVLDDHWETMLASVAPDPIAPTAESSFASAQASASFSNSHPSSRAGSSNSNSASSSRTHLTVPSRRQSFSFDQFMRACDTSEDDSASDTEAEDGDDIGYHGTFGGRSAITIVPNDADYIDAIGDSRRSGITIVAPPWYVPPPRDHRYSHAIRERSRESTAYVRSFYGEVTPFEHPRRMDEHLRTEEQLDGPAEERNNSDEEMTLDQELRDARALIERLTRREDISDDFWASVGLRRPVADRVERIQQREQL